MVGLSVRHRGNMPKKSIIRRTILALLLAVLCAVVLSSCRYLERQKEKRNMERVASEMALAYVEDTYGGKAEVLDIEVGTYEVIFRTEIDSDALVTVSLDGEEFQVYVETRPPQLCADNRSGLALGKALDEYFRNLYGLPQALGHSVRIYSNDEDFFASYPTSLGREYSFLDFDYHGQPLEEILPLVDWLAFQYDFLDDSVSLDHVVLRDEDWGGPVENRMRVSIRCFRRYDEQSEVPLGIQLVKDQPVMVAEGERAGPLFPKEHRPGPDDLTDPAAALTRLGTGEWRGRFRLLPYRSVGVDRGLLLAVRLDALELNGQGRGPALVALSPTPVSDGGGYQALIGAADQL